LRGKPDIVFFGNEPPFLDILGVMGRVKAVVAHAQNKRASRYFGSARDWAKNRGVPVIMPEEYLEKPLETDLGVVFGFGKLLPHRVRTVCRLGMINIHQSLLPAYRGRHPLNWAIINGEHESGVTVHHADNRFDTGAIITQHVISIGPDDTALDLHWATVAAGKKALAKALQMVGTHAFSGQPQDDRQSTYFPARKPTDGRIDFKRSAQEIQNLVRALVPPWPGAYFYKQGRKVVLDRVELLPDEVGEGLRPGSTFEHFGHICIKAGQGALVLEKTRNTLPPICRIARTEK